MNREENCCPSTSTDDGKADLLVIGAGSAGFSAAITAAEMGANVTIVGDGTIGGTCVNVGCVPSKTMIRAMDTLHSARAASRFDGLSAEARVENWNATIQQKQALVDELRAAKYIDVLPSYPNITYIAGRAELQEDGVKVGDKILYSSKIIITTGSSNALPPIPGIESMPTLDSTSALELTELPKSMMVIGGGVIGVELGQMFARAGVEVTICCRSRLVPDMEPEISSALQQYLEDEGIRVCAGIGYQRVEELDGTISLFCENQGVTSVITAEKILVAAGRRPNTKGLGLEAAGVEVDGRGSILVDDHLRTSNSNVYAAGDVTGRDMFVYMAAYGAKLAAQNAMNDEAKIYANGAMPAVVFTDPQVASVGLTEAQAASSNFDVKTSTITLDHVPRYIAARDTRGLIKLVADKDSDILIGAHILAPEAGELIQTAVLAVKNNMTTKQLGELIFPYLTGVEGLKLAAQTFDKDVSKLSCCAG